MLEGVQSIENVFASLDTPNLVYRFEYLHQEPHQNTPIYGAIGALRGLYPQWSIPYKSSVEGYQSVLGHFNHLSALYGYNIKPKAWQMYEEGIAQLNFLDNPHEAAKYFNYNIRRAPNDSVSRALLVDTYIKLGNKQEAIKHLDILLAQDDLSAKDRRELSDKKSAIE